MLPHCPLLLSPFTTFNTPHRSRHQLHVAALCLCFPSPSPPQVLAIRTRHTTMYPTTSGMLPSGMPSPSTIPPPPSLPFFFRRRIARLDFTRLHSINLDHLIQSVDIQTLQHTLDNLAFSDLTPADLPQLTPAVLVKGWRLLQLTVEYLLHVQSFLYHAHATAQYECEVLARKCVALKEQHKLALREQNKEVRKLKRELKHAQQQLNTLDSYSPTKPPPPPVFADGAVHACSECHAAFISASYLASHVKRRHPHMLSGKSSRRQQEEEKEQMSITITSDSDSSAGQRRPARGEEEDRARLRQIEAELRTERERDRQQFEQLEQRHRQADEQREMRWQHQLKQQQTSLIAHLSAQQQQVVSVDWLRDWQAEMQSMMESRLNDCFQREESKREARLIARLEAIEAHVRDVKGGELEAGVRRVIQEIAVLKADTARLIDVREERRKEEQRDAEDVEAEAAQREREAQELDERRRREEEADALTQRALLLEQQRLELERSQDALHSHSNSPTTSPTRLPRYPVVDSLPFLLARYPHSPATVERIVTGVEERAAEVERRREAEGGVSDEEMPEELQGVERRVDELVALHWREEDGQAERRVGLEERVRGLEMERDRIRRQAEDEQRRRAEEKREEDELEEAMRVLDRQKDEIERERAELNRREEEDERRRDAEMQAEIEREVAELKRDQLVQQERQRLAEKQRQRDEQDRRDREDEQRWRAEEVAREQLRAATLTPTPPLSAVSSIARSAPPPLQMPLSRQQSSPSLPTPAFTTHVAASPLSSKGVVSASMPTAMFSLESKSAERSYVEEEKKQAEAVADEDDEWGWEKDEEQEQHPPLPAKPVKPVMPAIIAPATRPAAATSAAATFQPAAAAAADGSDDDALTAALFKRGAAGGVKATNSPATLAERKQALMAQGFGLKLQTPQQRREEEEARRLRGQGRGGEMVELDSGSGGVSPVLQHPVKARAHIAGGARHGGRRGMVAAFRPPSAASNTSAVSGGSWDD